MNIALSECIAPHFYDLYKTIKQDKNTEYWLRGGRGSTKSSFIAIVIVLTIIRLKEANVVVFRRYENEVRDSVFSQIQWAIGMLGLDEEFKYYVRPFKIVYKKTGQVILFKAADQPQKLKSIKIPQGYVKFVWFEEVDQFAGMYQIRNLLQSLLRGTQEQQTVFYSYNPPKSARSWTNAETKISKPGRVVHYSDYRSVPKEWLGETFIREAEHLQSIDPEAYRHEYLGEETGTGLEVFTNIDIREISDKEIAYFDHRNQGLDFGYAADPLCFMEGHFDAKKRRLYLFDEIAGVGIKNSDLVKKLSEDQLAELTLADSAEPKSIDELRMEHGMNIIGAEKAPGSVEHGIKYLQDLEMIVIDPVRCPLAAKEFINYSLDVDRYGDVISKYPDKDNHSIDSVRYMMDLHIRQQRKERRKKKKTRALPTFNRWGR